MFKRGPIPPVVHGLLDYLIAAVLIAAPFVLGFEEDAATALSIAAGVAVLMLGAFTAWRTGIVKSIPPVAHAMLDYALAALLIALPFLAGFSDDGEASAFFVVVGVAGLVLTIATRFTPDRGRQNGVDVARTARPAR
jgi:VIT1/CCC1 family predicted Fe2+/Mn2+ transporter